MATRYATRYISVDRVPGHGDAHRCFQWCNMGVLYSPIDKL